jgi:hypothetical protein
MRICSRFVSNTSLGTIDTHAMPASAAKVAKAAPALPVLCSTTPAAPCSRSRDIVQEALRSLNEPLGLPPSSFTSSRPQPMAFAMPGTSISGVQPSPRVMRHATSCNGNIAA